MKRVLVTGGAGYIGSHACKALARAGYQPICFDNLERGHRWSVKWGPLEEGDLRKQADIDHALSTWKPWAVLHFAAYAYVGESTAEPTKYYRNNVGGTANLIDACVSHGCYNLVFSSSCATYGIPDELPIKETAAQRPVNPYGATKLVAERMLAEAGAASGRLRHVTLRYFNAAGADPDGEVGEFHRPETHLVPLVLEAAADSGRSIKIFGTDYPTADGTCIRDYIHVSDLADAHVMALEWLAAGRASRAFNLGNGHGYSVAEVVRTCERVSGRRICVETLPRRAGDPPILVSDSGNARSLLGWSPKFANLEDQVCHAWRWLRDAAPLLAD